MGDTVEGRQGLQVRGYNVEYILMVFLACGSCNGKGPGPYTLLLFPEFTFRIAH